MSTLKDQQRSFTLQTSPKINDYKVMFYQPIANGDQHILSSGIKGPGINGHKLRRSPSSAGSVRIITSPLILATIARSNTTRSKYYPETVRAYTTAAENAAAVKHSNATFYTHTKSACYQKQHKEVKTQKKPSDLKKKHYSPDMCRGQDKSVKKNEKLLPLLISYEEEKAYPSPRIDPYQMARLEMQKKLKEKKNMQLQMQQKERVAELLKGLGTVNKLAGPVANMQKGSTKTNDKDTAKKQGKSLAVQRRLTQIKSRVKPRAGPLVFSISFNSTQDELEIFDHEEMQKEMVLDGLDENGQDLDIEIESAKRISHFFSVEAKGDNFEVKMLDVLDTNNEAIANFEAAGDLFGNSSNTNDFQASSESFIGAVETEQRTTNVDLEYDSDFEIDMFSIQSTISTINGADSGSDELFKAFEGQNPASGTLQADKNAIDTFTFEA